MPLLPAPCSLRDIVGVCLLRGRDCERSRVGCSGILEKLTIGFSELAPALQWLILIAVALLVCFSLCGSAAVVLWCAVERHHRRETNRVWSAKLAKMRSDAAADITTSQSALN